MVEPTPQPDADPSLATGAEEPTFLSGAVSPTKSPSSANASPANSRTAIDVGAKLGPYLLEAKLGEGGMGAVYKARHEHLEKVVALKVLSAQVMQNADAVARFRREMKAVGKIEHANIVRAMDAGEVNGRHYLAMEYVEGSDLQQFIKNKGPVNAVVACKIIRQAALALSAAHTAGLIHRDIKPSNLLVSKAGQIKLLDLGLALLSCDTQESTELTTAGQTFGTPDYMAPEQWENSHAVDGRVDLYALGCTLFFLLSGRTPYSGERYRTAVSKMKGHVTSPIPDLKEAVPTVPDGVVAIYTKLLAKEPADRYQTAAELAEALGPFSSSKAAIPDGTAPSFTAIGLVSGAVNLTAPTGLPGATQKLSSGADETTFLATHLASLLSPPGNRRKLLLGGCGLVLLVAVIGYSLSGSKTTPPDSKPAEASLAPSIVESPTAPPIATGWHGWPADAPKPAIAPFNAAQAKKHQEEWAAYLKVPVEYTNTIGMKFRLIPPGEFTMGSTAAEIAAALKQVDPNEKHWQEYIKAEAPQHKVILTQPIYVGVNAVTQAEYEKVMGVNPSHFAPMGAGKEAVAGLETGEHPVETVSWNDAAEFCAKLSKREKLKPFYFRAGETITPLDGTGYRLPSEAEWEFACRAGTSTKYWVGDNDEDLVRVGWFRGNSGGRTHSAGELKANPFGLSDIHGNVFEWVQDGWDATYYGQFSEKPAIDPHGPFSADGQRVLRGGKWDGPASDCRSSYRHAGVPTLHVQIIGFRVSLTIDAVRQMLTVTGPEMPKAMATTQSAPAIAKTGWHGWPANAPKPAIAPFDSKEAKRHQEEWAKFLGTQVETVNSVGAKMMLIPPGEFLMGSTDEQVEAALKVVEEIKPDGDFIGRILKAERPQHKVAITKPFLLSETEVTIGQFKTFAAATGYQTEAEKAAIDGKSGTYLIANDDLPASYIVWNDATAYCKWLSEQEKRTYRLPTEAEWEYACRAGTTTLYSFGDDYIELPKYGWHIKNANGKLQTVGTLLPNPFGLFDMHGSLEEWCGDYYDEKWYSTSPPNDPKGPTVGSLRVIRGGHCILTAFQCRSAYRYGSTPSTRHSSHFGFRCVCD